MSPFHNSPHLWLTGHLHRLHQADQIVKIQALVRGFLHRRRHQKQQDAKALINDVLSRLQPPKQPVCLVELMRQLGLGIWADQMPSAVDALHDPALADKRRDLLWHAGISLRLTGQAAYVRDLEWSDYHERALALKTLDVHVHQDNLWDRFKKVFW